MIRCVGCKKRIRERQPHIGLEDYETGHEQPFHARRACQKRLVEVITSAAEAGNGKVYFVHYYHTCGDNRSGLNCYAGCFAGEEVLN